MNLFFRLLLLRLLVLRRPKLSIWDTATTPFRVVPTDLDVLGHMNNGKYLTLMDLGRLDLMLRSGLWRECVRRGWYPVVAGQTVTYQRSLKPGNASSCTPDRRFRRSLVDVEQVFAVGTTVRPGRRAPDSFTNPAAWSSSTA